MQEKTGKTAQGMHNSFVEGLSASWESFKDFMSGIGEQISGFFKKHPWVAPAAITLAAVGGLALAPFTGGASLAATAGALSIAALRSAPTMPSMSSVPYLAKGAVIPPNNEFLAVLGDQRSGYNIETPLAVMVEAFKTAIADMGIAGEKDITLHVVADRGFVRGLKFELDALDKYKGVNLVVTS